MLTFLLLAFSCDIMLGNFLFLMDNYPRRINIEHLKVSRLAFRSNYRWRAASFGLRMYRLLSATTPNLRSIPANKSSFSRQDQVNIALSR